MLPNRDDPPLGDIKGKWRSAAEGGRAVRDPTYGQPAPAAGMWPMAPGFQFQSLTPSQAREGDMCTAVLRFLPVERNVSIGFGWWNANSRLHRLSSFPL